MQETQETWVWSLGREDPLEAGMATHSSIPTWRTPWTEEPGGLRSTGLPRVRRDWSDLAHTHSEIQGPYSWPLSYTASFKIVIQMIAVKIAQLCCGLTMCGASGKHHPIYSPKPSYKEASRCLITVCSVKKNRGMSDFWRCPLPGSEPLALLEGTHIDTYQPP